MIFTNNKYLFEFFFSIYIKVSNSTTTNDDQLSQNKEIIDGKWFGFSSIQGHRPSMEDFHQHLTHLADHHLWKKYSYFSIFDGHSGSGTAHYGSNNLHIYLVHELNRLINHKENQSDNNKIRRRKFRHAIKKAFIKLDKQLRKIDYDKSGSVCIACLIGPKQIYLINVGDARAIIISDNGEVLASTHDHKPDDPKEEERIHEAGGHITQKSSKDILRVERRLAMTRVLGDFTIDKNVVPPIPDITIYPRKSSTGFIILASDGIWNVMSNEQVVSFVVQQISTTIKLDKIASQLLDHCLEK
ncbi:unnamed protein product [Rotaria sp. Silwood1]|nr:unnamed protein product [Rotaria sp. Silwood1]